MGVAPIWLQDVIGLWGDFQGKSEQTTGPQQSRTGLKDGDQVSSIDEYVCGQHQIAWLLARLR